MAAVGLAYTYTFTKRKHETARLNSIYKISFKNVQTFLGLIQ